MISESKFVRQLSACAKYGSALGALGLLGLAGIFKSEYLGLSFLSFFSYLNWFRLFRLYRYPMDKVETEKLGMVIPCSVLPAILVTMIIPNEPVLGFLGFLGYLGFLFPDPPSSKHVSVNPMTH